PISDLFTPRTLSSLHFNVFIPPAVALRDLHSFPTRRSSDLPARKSVQDESRDLFGEGRGGPITDDTTMERDHFLVRLPDGLTIRSEEHTSELQSRENIVCRLLLEKKNFCTDNNTHTHSNSTR